MILGGVKKYSESVVQMSWLNCAFCSVAVPRFGSASSLYFSPINLIHTSSAKAHHQQDSEYKHHNPHRIIIKRRPYCLRPRPHLNRIPHMPLTQPLPHPPLRPIHRPLLFLIHLILLRRRSRTHVRMHRLTAIKPTTPQLANDPMPPVARLSYVAIVPQPLHQGIVHARRILQRPPPRRPLAPAKAR
jgi:hypothetical protein